MKTPKHMKKITKRVLIGAAVATTAITAISLFVFKHKPAVAANPTHRSFYRADGVAKKAFDTPAKANFQVIKQLFLYGEICTPYQAGKKFYTGHNCNIPIRSINPIKAFK